MNYENIAIDLIVRRFDDAKNEFNDLLEYFKILSKQNKKSLCLFGAGSAGLEVYSFLLKNEIKIDFFCDNNPMKWGTLVVDDVKCLSIQELEEIKDEVAVIISIGAENQISKQLLGMGISEVFDRGLEIFHVSSQDIFLFSKDEVIYYIRKLFYILEDEISKKTAYYKIFSIFATKEQLRELSYKEIETLPQYFPNDIIKLNREEVYVDCGSYIGDTLNCFLKQYGHEYLKEYICYELDVINFEILKNYVNQLDEKVISKISLYNFGVADMHKKIMYLSNGGATSLGYNGDKDGEVVSIDGHIGYKEITSIKMDIEGSELFALAGAKQSIIKNKPKCSISCYHKAADLWEIPLYLKELVPEYKIYLRHHTCTYADTVCYSII